MHHFYCLTSGHFYHQDLLSWNFKIFPPKYRFFSREILWQLLKCHSPILLHALLKYIISPFRPDLHVFFFYIPRTQYKLGSVRTGGWCQYITSFYVCSSIFLNKVERIKLLSHIKLMTQKCFFHFILLAFMNHSIKLEQKYQKLYQVNIH